MERGLITGITRISKKVFSDLNNLEVVTATSNEYARFFGFMQKEIFDSLDAVGLGSEKQGVKKWYESAACNRLPENNKR